MTHLPVQASDPQLAPWRAFASDAGLDLKSSEDVVVPAGERILVSTGVRVALEEGTVGLVCPRSGLAARHGITIVNAPGVIDAGYRGELKVVLLNTDAREDFTISRGDRIAQLLVMPIMTPSIDLVEDIESVGSDAAERGDRGFGSSGSTNAPADAAESTSEEGHHGPVL